MTRFRGVFSVLPTPFNATGEIDYDSLASVIELYLGSGVQGLTVLGVTSETEQLTQAEREKVLMTVLSAVDGRVPVITGTTAAGTRACIELTRSAREAGARAVMISPPRLPKLNSDAVLRHFSEVADAVGIPIIVQDYPPVAGYAMEPALLARIAYDIPSARTIKLEDPPTPLKTARILSLADGLPIDILGGLGGGFLLEELLAGAAGAMTGFAYPEILVRVFRLFDSGDFDGAADYFYERVALMRFEFQAGVGLAIRKEMLRRRGALAHATVRAPVLNLDLHTSESLDRMLDWMERSRLEASWISA